jgi:hypothetical protein
MEKGIIIVTMLAFLALRCTFGSLAGSKSGGT